MNYLYEESEVPYGTLSQFGLTQEMVEDLPVDVLADIYNGRKSPVLPVTIKTEDGDTIRSRTRFALVRNDKDEVDLLFYPVHDEEDLKRFSEEQKIRLSGNRAVVGFVDGQHRITFDADAPDRGTKSFVQLDPETRQVLSVPVQVIGRNLQLIANNFGLSADQLQKMQEGEVVTVLQGEDPVSIGIDLNNKTGIRLASGDEQQWQRENKREWSKYTFGAFGCWVMDDNGNLDYVSEDDYSDELWNEQKKQGMRMGGR